jgi:membrane protease YdiL (CAAX protease family)
MQKTDDALVEDKSDAVPWTIQETFLGILATLVPWIVLVVGLSNLGGGKPARTTPLSPQTDLSSAIIIFIFSSVIEGAFLIAPLYFAYRAFRSFASRWRLAMRALGLRGFSFGKAFAWIIVLAVAILAVDNLYQYVITALHLNLQTNDQVILERSKYAPISTYATLLAAVLVAPICEEIFFRGFVFSGLRRAMPPGWAIFLSALIFAVAHADPGSFAVLFIIGLALAFLRWRTRSLWPGIALHFINNGLGALAIVLAMQGVVKP